MKRLLAMVLVAMLLVTAFSGCTHKGKDDGDGDDVEVPDGRKLAMESAPGEMGKDFLQDANYTRVVIEVDCVSTLVPSANALALLVQRIQAYCLKVSVTYVTSDSLEASQDSYTPEDIAAIEDANRDHYPDPLNATVTLYVLYLNGEMAESQSTIGLTYRGSSIAIFQERINAIEIPPLLASRLKHEDFEKSVLVHELGHVLSLVNIGYQSDLDYEDPEHPHHSIHEDCAMYYAVETSAIANLISSGSIKPPNDYQEDARHDLEMLRDGTF